MQLDREASYSKAGSFSEEVKLRAILLIICCLAARAPAQQGLPPPAEFEKDIAPILNTRCTVCHNDRNKTSGLSLQNPEGILARISH